METELTFEEIAAYFVYATVSVCLCVGILISLVGLLYSRADDSLLKEIKSDPDYELIGDIQIVRCPSLENVALIGLY